VQQLNLILGISINLIGDDFGLQNGSPDGVCPVKSLKEKVVVRRYPLAYRSLDGLTFVPTADTFKKNTRWNEQAIPHLSMQTSRAKMEWVVNPFFLR
jgi:hypothetical protein